MPLAVKDDIERTVKEFKRKQTRRIPEKNSKTNFGSNLEQEWSEIKEWVAEKKRRPKRKNPEDYSKWYFVHE